MPDFLADATSGVQAEGYREGPNTTDGWLQKVVPVKDRIESYRGRAATFSTPGRAGATQRLLAINNTTGSTVLVSVDRIRVDLQQTAAAVAIGVSAGAIRVQRISAVTAGSGATLIKNPENTSLTSNMSLTLTQDASADGTLASTGLAVTLLAGSGPLGQVWAPRLVQATATAGNVPVAELIDTAIFFSGETDIVLRAGEGLAVSVELATTTTGNPATHRWLCVVDWTEYTRP